MSDYFSQLGLAPGRHDPRVVTAQYLRVRAALLPLLDDPSRSAAARVRLDEAHVAFRVLTEPLDAVDPGPRPPARRAGETAQSFAADPRTELRRMIRGSLEDGLLRHSRRERIVARGRALGLGEFQTQLLIAQEQFELDEPWASAGVARGVADGSRRAAARLGAAGVLALAMLLAMVRWSSLA